MNASIIDEQDWKTLNDRIINCRLCPRLVAWREEVAIKKRRAYWDWEYWGKPVPGFGDTHARVLIVGLAPGAHGSNRTGRMFTGDSSGDFLYSALYRAGFANQPNTVHRGDGLELKNIFISAVCRCAPPDNKPNGDEITNCLIYLKQEIQLLDRLRVIVVLGRIAFDNILRVYREMGYDLDRQNFAHGVKYELGGNLPRLIVSYHPSRQNTQTGRLTQSMFDQIWEMARTTLEPEI
jgi:uracil-DNA glycosylase family 4